MYFILNHSSFLTNTSLATRVQQEFCFLARALLSCCFRSSNSFITRNELSIYLRHTHTHTNFNTSCRELFRDLGSLTLHSQYILSLVMFVSKNMNDFTTNSDIHPCNTRNNNNLHPPLTRLTKYQNGASYSGINLLKPSGYFTYHHV